jgi:vacuolar-type H+-ATPase subunit E/Vma4
MTQPSEKLFDEVMADARTKTDRAHRRGQRDAESARKKIAKATQVQVDKILDAARAEAESRRSQILATLEIEAQRERLARLEESLAGVHDRVAAAIRSLDPGAMRRAQVRLAVEAIAQIPDTSVELALPPDTHADAGQEIVADVMQLVAQESDRPVAVRLADRPAQIPSGVLVRAAGRSVEVVNSLEERLRRLWPELRLVAAQRLFPELVAAPETGQAREEDVGQ